MDEIVASHESEDGTGWDLIVYLMEGFLNEIYKPVMWGIVGAILFS